LPSRAGNRIWFPEMIGMLRSQWNPSMTLPRFVELCEKLDGALQQRRPIIGPSLPPGSRCPKCGRIMKAEDSGPYLISVRAAILALGRFGIASPELTKKLERTGPNTRLRNGWICTAVRQRNKLREIKIVALAVLTLYGVEQKRESPLYPNGANII